jgi:hypothetical protein
MEYTEILIEGGFAERSINVAGQLFSTLTDEEKLLPLYWPVFKDD